MYIYIYIHQNIFAAVFVYLISTPRSPPGGLFRGALAAPGGHRVGHGSWHSLRLLRGRSSSLCFLSLSLFPRSHLFPLPLSFFLSLSLTLSVSCFFPLLFLSLSLSRSVPSPPCTASFAERFPSESARARQLSIYLSIYLSTYICIYIHTSLSIYIYICVYTFIYTYICVHTCIYKYIHS